MQLLEWANKHGVSTQALQELYQIHNLDPVPATGFSEAAVQVQVRLEASRMGWRVFRNNVGVLQDERGVPVRYGLANDSSAMNKSIKSSDLIGIRPLIIHPSMVGKVVGQFVAIEVKQSGWKFSGNDREAAQLKFLQLIESLGGKGIFASDPSHLGEIL